MGEDGDRINTKLAGCGFSFRRVVRAILFDLILFTPKSIKYGKLLNMLTLSTKLSNCRLLENGFIRNAYLVVFGLGKKNGLICVG